VTVDEISGDVQALPGQPLALELLGSDGSTVLKSSAGSTALRHSRSLRFVNSSSSAITTQRVRIRSGGCTTTCGADDVYRVRGYETTVSIPRFNNAGTQLTVLLLQNPTEQAIAGTVYFWSATGILLASQPFSLGSKSTLVLNTLTLAGAIGASGAITVAMSP
jgi:hypothetical protein